MSIIQKNQFILISNILNLTSTLQIALSNQLKDFDKENRLDSGCIEKLQTRKLHKTNLENECFHQEHVALIYSNLKRLRKFYYLEFVDVFCHEAVKIMDISTKVG